MKNLLVLVCLFKILSLFVIGGENARTLKMVHLVYRHGARSPVAFYPTNPNINKWPDGTGRLTPIGMNLEFGLGKFLKDRYITNTRFINPMYLHDEVYIRSSDEDRCLQSAESQLAALYPPMGRQVWNQNLSWQPVPIHTVPKDKDPILRPDGTNCPRLSEIEEEKKNEPIYKEKIKEHENLLQYLTVYSGMNVTFDNAYIIADDYLCERTQNLSSPDWVLARLNELVDVSTWTFLNKYSGDDEVGRILGGSFLNLIINNMKQMSEGTKSTDLFKMNIFSGHDTSLLSLAAGLDIQMTVPPFASCIMLELHADESNNYYVEMQYRNDSSGTLYPLELKECQFSCPLQAFISLTKNRVTDNQAKECMTADSSKASKKYLVQKIYLTMISLLLASTVILLVFVTWYLCKSRRTKNLYLDEEKNQLMLDEE